MLNLNPQHRAGVRWDVAVIGGGAAGLSAALVLARSRRAVIVIDAGAPRNAPADGVHGFLTRDGISPAELLSIGRQEVECYGGQIVNGTAQAARHTDAGFEVTLSDGATLVARRLVVTTGLIDELPDIPGVRERWGKNVLHCPYCHGWEVRDRPIGVLASGPQAVHQALLFRQLTDDVIFFSHTGPALTAEQAEQLAARDIRIVPGVVESLVIADDRLAGVRLDDGTVVERQAMVVGPRFVARSGVLAGLGLQPVLHPRGFGEHIPAGPSGQTAVPGFWVAGNVTDLSAQVVTAAAGGAVVAAAVNADLVAEDTQQALLASRGTSSPDSQHLARRAS